MKMFLLSSLVNDVRPRLETRPRSDDGAPLSPSTPHSPRPSRETDFRTLRARINDDLAGGDKASRPHPDRPDVPHAHTQFGRDASLAHRPASLLPFGRNATMTALGRDGPIPRDGAPSAGVSERLKRVVLPLRASGGGPASGRDRSFLHLPDRSVAMASADVQARTLLRREGCRGRVARRGSETRRVCRIAGQKTRFAEGERKGGRWGLSRAGRGWWRRPRSACAGALTAGWEESVSSRLLGQREERSPLSLESAELFVHLFKEVRTRTSALTA